MSIKQRTARDRELDELEEESTREWTRFRRQSLQRISAALSNEAGFARLRAITDEEWEAAELEGEPEEAGGAP
jgi:hypothetical protein